MRSRSSPAHIQLGPNETRSQIVRQDRHVSDGGLELETPQGKLKVLNFSLFGLGAFSPDKIDIDSVIPESKLIYLNETIADLSLVVRRCQPSDTGFLWGLEAISDALPVDKIRCIKEIADLSDTIEKKVNRYSKLPDKFRLLIMEASSKMRNYQSIVRSFENRVYQSRSERELTYSSLIEKFGKIIFDLISQTNWKLQTPMQDQPDDILKMGFQFFRDELGEFIFQSPFTKRSYEKPRGYSGDFEMMRQIYSNDSFSMTLFGSCVENAVQRHSEPAAVRNRSSYLADKLISEIQSNGNQLNFLSVAAGPAEEVRKVVETLDDKSLSRITFWLLDQDEEALKFAQRNIREAALQHKKTVNVRLINEGIKQLLVRGLEFREFDLIYSAGLFDYFTDPVAVRAARALSEGLARNGKLIIGNFNVGSPNWFGMLTLFDWHLILRSEEDLMRLFDNPGFTRRVESEAENVNLFCIVTRNG